MPAVFFLLSIGWFVVALIKQSNLMMLSAIWNMLAGILVLFLQKEDKK